MSVKVPYVKELKKKKKKKKLKQKILSLSNVTLKHVSNGLEFPIITFNHG